MIYSWSKFNYGQTSSLGTQTIPFREGSGPQLNATIPIGGYTLQQYAQAVADAMNTVGSLGYQTSVNRTTNAITISAPSAFSLLVSQPSTAYPMIGFAQTADLVGQTSYTGNMQSGLQYYPQFKLQSYVPSANYAQSVSATINESASGMIEVVRFGVNRLIEMELKFITNLATDGTVIRNNRMGLQAALAFLDFATTKTPFEFVPDVNQPGIYQNVLLEKTEAASDGTGYKLKELYTENVPDVYETGVLTFRVVS